MKSAGVTNGHEHSICGQGVVMKARGSVKLSAYSLNFQSKSFCHKKDQSKLSSCDVVSCCEEKFFKRFIMDVHQKTRNYSLQLMYDGLRLMQDNKILKAIESFDR